MSNETNDFLEQPNTDFNKSENELDVLDEGSQEDNTQGGTQEEGDETDGNENGDENGKKVDTVPFHKDPKVQRYVERQIAKAMESIPKPVVDTPKDEDDYYARLIGNDTPEKVAMIREAKERDEKLINQAEERAFSRLTESQKQEAEADKKALEQLDSSLEDIEEQYSVDITSNTPVARKLRVDFLKFAERLAPKDRDGNIVDYPDMNTTFEMFQEKKPTKQDKAKDLASRSMNRSAEVSDKPKEKVTFDNVDNLFERMFLGSK